MVAALVPAVVLAVMAAGGCSVCCGSYYGSASVPAVVASAIPGAAAVYCLSTGFPS